MASHHRGLCFSFPIHLQVWMRNDVKFLSFRAIKKERMQEKVH